MTDRTIITCTCGQQNRLPAAPVPPGFRTICGKCRQTIALDDDLEADEADDDEDLDDEDGGDA